MNMRIGIALASALLLLPATALSQEAADTAFQRWVAATDATVEWSARYSDLSYDANTDALTVGQLVLGSEQPGMEIVAEALTVTGFSVRSDGTVKIDAYTADRIVFESVILHAGWTDVRVKGFAFPPISPLGHRLIKSHPDSG